MEASSSPGLYSPGAEPRTFSQAFPVLLEASPETVLLGVCLLHNLDLPSHLGAPASTSPVRPTSLHLADKYKSVSDTGPDTYLGSPPSLAISFYLCEHTLTAHRKQGNSPRLLEPHSVGIGANGTGSQYPDQLQLMETHKTRI